MIERLSERKWQGSIERIPGSNDEFLLRISKDGDSLETIIEGNGGKPPDIISIDEILATDCDLPYVVVSAQTFFYFESPSFYTRRYIFSLEDQAYVLSVFDKQTSIAGGLVPARISDPIHDALSCES